MSEAVDREDQLRTDFKSTFATPTGQRVLEDLIDRFHVGRTVFVAGSPDETAFREGQRSVINFICEFCNPNWMKPDVYLNQTIPRIFATERH